MALREGRDAFARRHHEFGPGDCGAVVQDDPRHALRIGEREMLHNEAAMRMAQQQHIGKIERVHQTGELPAAALHAIGAEVIGQTSGGTGSDRLDVQSGKMLFDQWRPEIFPVDTRTTGMHDAKRPTSRDMVSLLDSIDGDGMGAGRECLFMLMTNNRPLWPVGDRRCRLEGRDLSEADRWICGRVMSGLFAMDRPPPFAPIRRLNRG